MTAARPAFIGALLLAVCARVAAQDKAPAPEQLAAAEAAVATARAEKEAAGAALEALVTELKDDFEKLTGPDSTTLRHAMALAMSDALPVARTRLASEVAKGRAVLRGTRRQILQDAFNGPVAATSGIDPRLSAYLVRRVADAFAARESFDGLDEQAVFAQVEAAMPAETSWYDFWNQSFHIGLPEAEHWTKTQTVYEAAGVKLDRLLHPERYGSKGEVAPPGMVIVPGGSYELGPNAGWEKAARKVRLDVFAVDRHEVTEAEYEVFVNEQPPEKRAKLLPRGWQLDGHGAAAVSTERRDLPVVQVNWEQAAAYAAWIGKRLPTEDEWEAAAGGVDGRSFPWGNEFHIGLCNGADGASGVLPVESFPNAPAPSGALDMAGNVWEWTSTLEDGSNFKELPEGLVNVVIRGGGFDSRREELATRYRWTAPGHEAFGSSRYTRPIGFRCVKDL
jgi:formylglycine-generating enzyme required for sulfatase activity